jgi:iron complex transport system ATP-binding protein
MIEIKDVSLSYGTHTVLENFSAQVSGGTITAIIGGNGAGKSTLVSAIAGAIKPNTGSITIDGKDVGALSAQELASLRSVAQQSHSYWMSYTVAQILALGHENIVQPRFDKVAKEFGLAEVLQQSITTLSGGQLQRVEIARAFMRDVPIALLDEPFASQDLASQEKLIAIFQEERKKGRTILLVAHRDRSNLAWCDQIIDLGQ